MTSLKRLIAGSAALLVLGAGPALAQSSPGWREAAAEAREAGDPARLIQVLSAAAAGGSTQARTQLGDIYREGQLVPQDLSMAARWYREAGRGEGHALNMLGRMHFEGLGVDQDRDAAMALLHQAAALGTPAHVHDYAAALEMRGEPGDVEAAAGWYRDAADAGHPPALTSLGVLYLEGRGVDADIEQARALFEQAAEAGDARGQNNLGLLYVRGDGVAQDYERAAELFRAAADQGVAQAMTNLGVLYANGFGVALDESEAERLYRAAGMQERSGFDAMSAALLSAWSDRLAPFDPGADAAARDAAAAAIGDPIGLYALGYRFATGRGRPSDPVRAAEFYQRAAEAGFAPAALGLGVLYVRGIGVPQDFGEAYRHLAFAAAAGESGAADLRDQVLARMSERQRASVLETRPADREN